MSADKSKDIFAALAHPNRRDILRRLSVTGAVALTVLAADFDTSRQAVRKHVQVLADAGLVSVSESGRTRMVELQAERLQEVAEWVSFFEDHWDTKLAALKRHVEDTA